MALFRRRGLQPIPAPADFEARNTQSSDPMRFFTGVGSLVQTETAVHEYLGLAWAGPARGDLRGSGTAKKGSPN